MAWTHWRTGHCTSESISVWIRANDVGPYAVAVGADSANVSTPAPANTGYREVTGLNPDTRYEIKVGGAVVGQVKTLKAEANSQTTKVTTGHCHQMDRNMPHAKQILNFGSDVHFWLGDQGYHHAQTRWQDENKLNQTAVRCDEPPVAGPVTPASDWHNRNKMWESVVGVRRVNQNIPNYYIPSNHDVGGGIDDRGLKSCRADGAAMNTQALANDNYEQAIIALNDYRPDPPYSPESLDGRDIPEAALDGAYNDVTIYDPRWYKVRSGCAEFFVIDDGGGKTKNTRTDGAGSYMLGANQETWLIREVLASTATWKVIVSSHTVFAAAPGGVGGDWENFWSNRGTQLTRIFNALSSVAGLLFLGGNWHAPSVNLGNLNGYPDFVSCTFGPSGQAHNISSQDVELDSDLTYGGVMQSSHIMQHCHGQHEFRPNGATLSAVNMSGDKRLEIEMIPSSNAAQSVTVSPIPNFYTGTPNFGGSGDDEAAGWRSNNTYAMQTGWLYDTDARFAGFSFDSRDFPSLTGKYIRSAELDVYFLDATPSGETEPPNISTGLIGFWHTLPSTTGSNVPWSPSNRPRDVGVKNGLRDLTIPAEWGWLRIDVTDDVRNFVDDINYLVDPLYWLNFVFQIPSIPAGDEVVYISSPDSATPTNKYTPRLRITVAESE